MDPDSKELQLAQQKATIEQEVKNGLEQQSDVSKFLNPFPNKVLAAWNQRGDKNKSGEDNVVQRDRYKHEGEVVGDHSEKYYSGTVGVLIKQY